MNESLGVAPHDLRRLWIGGVVWRTPRAVPVEALRDVLSAAMLTAPPAGTVLGGRGSVFLRALAPFGQVAVKEYRRGGHVSRFVSAHHLRRGPSRGEREFRNLRAVRAIGIHAPEPLAFASRGLLLYRGWLVTKYVPNRGSLASLGHSSADRLEELVAATAWQVGALIDRGILHADLHPGNVIVDAHEVPCLLDFDRACRFHGSAQELCRRYASRWVRAVRKHGLPEVIADVFTVELARIAGASGARIHDVAPARG